jgi:DNA-binding transcriptional regulator YiaG
MTVKRSVGGDAIRCAEGRTLAPVATLYRMSKPLSARNTRATHKEFVGENLVTARLALRRSQAALARELKIAPNKLNQWEKGLYYPDPWLLKQLCEDHGFTMDWFYRRLRASVSAELAADLKRVMEGAEAV